ncbi:MAG: CRTAC1 family protein, partial [Candidatus Kapaibacterium sp.]
MTSYSRYVFLLLLSFGMCAGLHAQTPLSATLFEFLTPERTGVFFSNNIVETESYNALAYANAYNGNGVAVGDVNGDGLPDLFFTGTHVSSRLYLNRGDFHFEDVTAKAGLLDSSGIERGAVMADIDGDGDLDLYICRIRARNLLYINNGNGTFTESGKKFGLDYLGNSTHAVFFDYDNDGDLDMYLGLTGNSTQDYYARWGDCDKLFRNDGKGKFTEVTKQAGINDAGYCNNVVVGDVNNDGWADIFVCNDFEGRDCLYMNNHNGTFTQATGDRLLHMSNSSMGSDVADYNNDGLPDILSVDMLPEDRFYQLVAAPPMSVYNPTYDSIQVQQNVLQLNRGNGYFSEIAPFAGVVATQWSWPALIADFDNDGYKDIFIGNGMRRFVNNADSTYRMAQGSPTLAMTRKLGSLHTPNYAFRNNHDLKFSDVSAQWGLDQLSYTNGAVYVDLDQDGDLDLVMNNIDSAAFIMRNHAVEHHLGNFLRVKLEGIGMNRFGVGARVEMRTGSGLQMQENFPSRGYISTVDQVLVFGLGADTAIGELTVKWPGGARQMLTNVRANQTITLKQADASKKGIVPPKAITPLFTTLDTNQGINFRHTENTFDDLKRERLLPHRLSQLGPGIAVGDVDGDGREDVYIGNAQGMSKRLFLQQQDGHFVKSKDTATFDADAGSEDMGAVFFDADGDGDLDLYVVSGGNDFFENADALQDRLYLNDGKGHFTKSVGALPEETTSGSCVVAGDYDGDGDLDLFVGGRVIPGKYPMPTRSYILRNDGGKFTDVTAEVAPELVKAGMVCAALWSDFDNDGKLDLVCTGE